MGLKVQLNGLTSIVAIDAHGAIGCRNTLPWSLKTDMAFFRQQTLGNSIIMGRKTYDSIGSCLPGRTNIVLSHNNVLFNGTKDCQLALSVSEALYRVAKSNKKSAFVVGGALTYHQFAAYIDRYLVTFVDTTIYDADTFLDSDVLSTFDTWDRNLLMDHQATEGRDQFAFQTYEIIPPDAFERRERIKTAIAEYEDCLVGRGLKTRNANVLQPPGQDAFAF